MYLMVKMYTVSMELTPAPQIFRIHKKPVAKRHQNRVFRIISIQLKMPRKMSRNILQVVLRPDQTNGICSTNVRFHDS